MTIIEALETVKNLGFATSFDEALEQAQKLVAVAGSVAVGTDAGAPETNEQQPAPVEE